MKAVVISRFGDADVLKVIERSNREPRSSEVLIRVKAAGLNRADLIQRAGHYSPPAGVPEDIPGLEVAGIVAACGSEVQRWKIGDSVCALLAGGGYAEEVLVEAGHCLPVPPGWSFTDAAAVPEAIFTVWHNVFQRGRLKANDRFLVHGGSSGIGLASIQLATLFGSRVFATAGTEEKCRACENAGAERAINYRTADFEAELATEGVDVILDMVGGSYVPKNIRLLRPEGRLIFINAMKGAKAEFNALEIMSRRLTITGSTLRSRESEFKTSLASNVELQVWPLLAARQFRANVFKVFSLEDVAQAHRLMESSSHIGKIVLEVERP
jgi:putative PIG3 family NAD(P)H quinone oxidoreductase